MSFPYPPKPWEDGQTVRKELDDGVVLIGVYSAEKNVWHFTRSTTSGGSGVVTTADVFTLNARPQTVFNPFSLSDEPGTVVNQQEANWWMFEDIDKRARKAIISRIEPTEHPLYTTSEKELIQGDLWVDTTKDVLFWYDGTYWQEFSGGRPPIFSDTEPLVHPNFQPPNDELISGDYWYDITDPNNIVPYIYDGNEWLNVSGNQTISIGDTPPADAINGELWWNSSEDELTLYVYYDGQWVPAAPPVSLDGINATIATALEVQESILNRLNDGEAIQTSLQETVDDALVVQDGKVDKSGDTMTGRLNAPKIAANGNVTENSRVFEAQFNGLTNAWINGTGQIRTNFVLDDSSEFKTLTTKQYVDDKDAANRTYVDTKVDEIVIPDVSEFATETYVDSAVADLASETYVDTAVNGLATETYVDNAVATVPTPRKYPGLRFGFGNGTVAVGVFNFNYYLDGSQLKLRISTNSKDYKWNDGGLTQDYSFSEGHRFSISEKLSNGDLKIIRTGTYNRIDYHSNDILVYVSSHKTNGSFQTGDVDYYIVLSGVF